MKCRAAESVGLVENSGTSQATERNRLAPGLQFTCKCFIILYIDTGDAGRACFLVLRQHGQGDFAAAPEEMKPEFVGRLTLQEQRGNGRSEIRESKE
jgi:hypothetical protein